MHLIKLPSKPPKVEERELCFQGEFTGNRSLRPLRGCPDTFPHAGSLLPLEAAPCPKLNDRDVISLRNTKTSTAPFRHCTKGTVVSVAH